MDNERRPKAPIEPPTKATDQSITAHSRLPGVDLLTMTDRERECHLSGYLSGVLAGIDHGREQMEEEMAALHRRAWKIVQGMSKLLPWQEAEQDRRRRQDEAGAHNRAAGQPWPLEVAS